MMMFLLLSSVTIWPMIPMNRHRTTAMTIFYLSCRLLMMKKMSPTVLQIRLNTSILLIHHYSQHPSHWNHTTQLRPCLPTINFKLIFRKSFQTIERIWSSKMKFSTYFNITPMTITWPSQRQLWPINLSKDRCCHHQHFSRKYSNQLIDTGQPLPQLQESFESITGVPRLWLILLQMQLRFGSLVSKFWLAISSHLHGYYISQLSSMSLASGKSQLVISISLSLLVFQSINWYQTTLAPITGKFESVTGVPRLWLILHQMQLMFGSSVSKFWSAISSHSRGYHISQLLSMLLASSKSQLVISISLSLLVFQSINWYRTTLAPITGKFWIRYRCSTPMVDSPPDAIEVWIFGIQVLISYK